MTMTTRRHHRYQAGFSLLETLIVMLIIGILAAAIVPKVLDAVVQARESAALQHLRAIHAAQAAHLSKRGEFAARLADLGPVPPGSGLIPSELAAGTKMGYRFDIVPSSPEAGGYAVTAQPDSASTLARSCRSFYSDASLVIRHAPAGTAAVATLESPELGSRSN